jgi:ferric-dicitrate binding protein FerR (iron transport regulator)
MRARETGGRAVRIRELYLLYLEGRLDDSGAAELRKLLEENPDRRREILDDQEIQGLLGQVQFDEQAFLRSIRERLDAEKDPEPFARALRSRIRRRLVIGWAAAVAVILSVFLFWPDEKPAPPPVVKKPKPPAEKVPPLPPDPAGKVPPILPEPEVKPTSPPPPPPPPPEPPKPEPELPPPPAPPPAPPPPPPEKKETRIAVAMFNGKEAFPGDELAGPGAIEFSDKTKLDLWPATRVKLENTIEVLSGVLSANVSKQKQPLEFATPHAKVKVLGTILSIVVEPDRTRVDVTEGRVQVNGVTLAKGQFTVVSKETAPPKPLLSPNRHDDWDWVTHCKAIYRPNKNKTPGFVIHIGDSISWARPFEHWPNHGKGKTPEDIEILNWCHAANVPADAPQNDTSSKNGFYLSTANTGSNRGMTAAGRFGAVEFVRGEGMPAITDPEKAREAIADGQKYPTQLQIDTVAAAFNDAQFAVVMLGTVDLRAGRSANEFITALGKVVAALEKRNIVVILSTIPPHPGKDAVPYNDAIRKLAQSRGLPLIDFYAEIIARAGNDWEGALVEKGNMHPTPGLDDPYLPGGNPAVHATGENCHKMGYLLRSWLTVQKLKEIRERLVMK